MFRRVLVRRARARARVCVCVCVCLTSNVVSLDVSNVSNVCNVSA
jgi:hypothetical protein